MLDNLGKRYANPGVDSIGRAECTRALHEAVRSQTHFRSIFSLFLFVSGSGTDLRYLGPRRNLASFIPTLNRDRET